MPESPSRSRLIIRKPAARGATATRPRPGYIWGAEDFARARRRIETEIEEARRPAERDRLNTLAAFVEAATCRRAILLRHFGEQPAEACGNCDNCIDPPATIDVTEVARKLLSAAFRTEMRFGVGHLASVLGGDDNEKVRQFGHHKLSVFGIMTADELALVRPVARSLQARDALRADDLAASASVRRQRRF